MIKPSNYKATAANIVKALKKRWVPHKIPSVDKAYFENVHTMVLVSVFPRSGSTLLGYLLTAHRNMIVANEPIDKESLYSEVPFMDLLNYILYTDKLRFEDAIKLSEASPETTALSNNKVRRYYDQAERYKFVPNQWQARCESLHVIGIKNSLGLVKNLCSEDTFEKFRARLKKSGIRRLKFILTVRNPYDMITTGVVYRKNNPKFGPISEKEIYRMLDKRLKGQLILQCEMATKLFGLMEPRDIFLSRHEDLVAAPAEQLSKLCEFLNVPALPDYLKDCASIVHENPNKSRYELEWSEERKAKMSEIIEKYNFLAGYSWDS